MPLEDILEYINGDKEDNKTIKKRILSIDSNKTMRPNENTNPNNMKKKKIGGLKGGK
jgi:hypothetical protein